MNDIKQTLVEESKRCLNCSSPRCVQACPLHNNIPQILSLVKESRFEEAFYIEMENNPLGAICGLVCPHEKLCMGACIRRIKGKSVKIGKIEHNLCQLFLTDIKPKNVQKTSDKKVAIIGGGPAGVSCAYFLAYRGISSTVFEKEDKLGGILTYGIPGFRLNKKLVERVMNYVTNNPLIDVKTNHILVNNIEIHDEKYTPITIDELKKQGYDYVYITIGKEKSKMLTIEGADSKNVFSANEFLRMTEENLKSSLQGKKVVTIGGGNVAIDSSRLAKRVGAVSKIIYRRRKEDMPANAVEIEEAENEGVEFSFQKNVIKIIETPNKEYALNLFLDDGSEEQTDYFIMAIGSELNKDYFDERIKLDENGKIVKNENNETTLNGVYAGGDLATDANLVVNAISTAKEFAKLIE